MSLLYVGVAVSNYGLNTALWMNDIGHPLESYPRSPEGLESLIASLEHLAQEHPNQRLALVLAKPFELAETLLEEALKRQWQLSMPASKPFSAWLRSHGSQVPQSAASAVMLARYAQSSGAQLQALTSSAELAQATIAANKEDTLNRQSMVDSFQNWWNGLLHSIKTAHPLVYLALLIVVAIRVIKLDTIPGDLYGDIAIIIDYVEDILEGKWPTHFDLSAGPLYHYLVTPLLALGGLTYLNIKIASVVCSLLILWFVYLLGRDLVNSTFGWISFFCAGVGTWLLIFSRLGNSQIMVPLLAIGSVYAVVRGFQRQQSAWIVVGALLAAAGLYVYPQSFVIPGVTGIVLAWLIWSEKGAGWWPFWIYFGATLLAALPFTVIFIRDLPLFLSGYIGEKLPEGSQFSEILLVNLRKSLLALHVEGDNVFRSNPNKLPQLDLLSGIFFIGGLVFWLLRKQFRNGLVLIIPLLLLQVPAVLVRDSIELPSASRTIGIVPFVSLIVAGGVYGLGLLLQRWSLVQRAVVLLALLCILGLNSYRYFVVYVQAQPDRNVAIGREISTYVRTKPLDQTVVLLGCCWSERGQPHPHAIEYDIEPERKFIHIPLEDATCERLNDIPGPVILVLGREQDLTANNLASCIGQIPYQTHTAASGKAVFFSLEWLSRFDMSNAVWYNARS
jgi:4-amino-4-deoxy-L-arabinose transferase-like glycosyltransferase